MRSKLQGREREGARSSVRPRGHWILCQRVHDHWSGYRCGWPNEQWCQALLDPREPTFIRLFCTCVIVEDADCRHGVVRSIDYVIGYEARDIADDRDCLFLDPVC